MLKFRRGGSKGGKEHEKEKKENRVDSQVLKKKSIIILGSDGD